MRASRPSFGMPPASLSCPAARRLRNWARACACSAAAAWVRSGDGYLAVLAQRTLTPMASPTVPFHVTCQPFGGPWT